MNNCTKLVVIRARMPTLLGSYVIIIVIILISNNFVHFQLHIKKMKGFKWQGSQDNLHTQRPRPPPPPNTGLTNDQTVAANSSQENPTWLPLYTPLITSLFLAHNSLVFQEGHPQATIIGYHLKGQHVVHMCVHNLGQITWLHSITSRGMCSLCVCSCSTI